MILDFITSLG